MNAISQTRRRPALRYLLALGVVIVCGLAARSPALGLPVFVSKPLGDLLWALALFLLIGLEAQRLSTALLAGLTFGVASLVEFSQLIQNSWLDGVRQTLPGRLLLGSVFHPPDFLYYGVGVLLGVALERWLLRRKAQPSLGESVRETT